MSYSTGKKVQHSESILKIGMGQADLKMGNIKTK